MDLGAQETLANPHPCGYGLCGHPDVDPEASDVRLPHVLVHVVSSEFSRKPEIPADRLPYLHSVQRSCQRIDDAVRDRPVVLVPQVVGCDEVEASAENRSEEQLDPFGGDRAELLATDRAGLD